MIPVIKGEIPLKAHAHRADDILTSVRIAKEFGLLCSGGSDFHGATKPGVKLGVGNGNLRVSFENYLSLKNICVNR